MHWLENLLFLLVIGLVLGCHSAPSPPVVASGTESGTVTVEITHGDIRQSFQVENVAAGTSVESLMRSITQVPVTIHGSGTTAFVDSIGDQATGGSEGWIYKIDGKFANEGIGTTTLTPPTTLSWSYGEGFE